MANKGAREIEIFQQFSLLMPRSITWGKVNTSFCHLCSQARNGSEAQGEKGKGIIHGKGYWVAGTVAWREGQYNSVSFLKFNFSFKFEILKMITIK